MIKQGRNENIILRGGRRNTILCILVYFFVLYNIFFECGKDLASLPAMMGTERVRG